MNRPCGPSVSWTYAPNAARQWGPVYLGPNFHPFATEMAKWLRQQGKLWYSTERHRQVAAAYTNPHTYAGSSISVILARIVNDVVGFTLGDGSFVDPIDAEAARVRFISEFYLYQARFIEVVIKQLLYCTDLDERKYGPAALGELLLYTRNGNISFLGSLAEKFGLRAAFDVDVFPVLHEINRTRKEHAAHASSLTFDVRTHEESRAHMEAESRPVLDTFADVLVGLAHLETAMTQDLGGKKSSLLLLYLGGDSSRSEHVRISSEVPKLEPDAP